MKKIQLLSIIDKLVSYCPRLIKGEQLTSKYIQSILKDYLVNYVVQDFLTSIPMQKSCSLKADGEHVECEATSMVSGIINSKDTIISSLTSSQSFISTSNINFNPRSSYICKPNHYFAPSLAVSRFDIPKILLSKKVEGYVEVKKVKYSSSNILVGNSLNPQTIIFTHYDSIGPGAIDNASGVAVCLRLITDYPEILKKNLFVIAGNEELSYDYPIYWGHGYREFEKIYFKILKYCKQILAIDCVGNGNTNVYQNTRITELSLPLNNNSIYQNKVFNVSGDIDQLFDVYHGIDDVPKYLKDTFLAECIQMVKQKIDSIL